MATDTQLIPFHVADPKAEVALVFVHGFGGRPEVTWGKFPDFLTNDARMHGWDLFSLGYSTALSVDVIGIWAADPDLSTLATYLYTALKRV